MAVALVSLCLMFVFAVPSAFAAADVPEFSWDKETSTFTVTYNGADPLVIGTSFFSNSEYSSAIDATGVNHVFTYIGTADDTDPVKRFVIKGSGPVEIQNLRVRGMAEFDASEGNLTTIQPGSVFYDPTTLTSFKVGKGLKELYMGIFTGSPLETLDLSNTSLEKITGYAQRVSFDVKLPATLKRIEGATTSDIQCGFANSQIKSVIFHPDTQLEYVGPGLFRGAKQLETVEIPASCISLLPDGSFDDTPALKTVTVTGDASVEDINRLKELIRSSAEIVYTTQEAEVTFNTMGGSTLEPVSVVKGQLLEKPADPTRDGYTFTGWFTDVTCKQAFDFETPITEGITLYAGWRAGEANPPVDSSDDQNNNPTDDSKNPDAEAGEGNDKDNGKENPRRTTDNGAAAANQQTGTKATAASASPKTGDESAILGMSLAGAVVALAALGGTLEYRRRKSH